ncbi:unnamed protein product [Spirodela intermedia]|uniref:KIB1-4 beta-propeller domain-containing protein n=1 Tax=Spirodela intermedia TaxID=51605 RepID=A0A7I8IH39_SPIIN|nr:unnamed protein product [Spirodela intermedia]CAA6657203.1 unnamed protein product [Spirodela intermedia]
MIPSALVGTLTGLLGLADQVRMGAVCRRWRLAVADGFCCRPPAPSLFSEGMRRYTIRMGMEELSDMVCIGSSQGWLMMADELQQLQALNPITRTKLLFFTSGDTSSLDDPFFASGGRSSDSVVVAVLRRRNQKMSELSFAVAGDDEWTEIEAPMTRFEDIAAHDGKLYALGDTGRVLVCDFGGEPRSSRRRRRPRSMEYLGVMSGDLILLRWRFYRACPIRRRRCVPEFEVLRLRTGRRPEWVGLKDLAGHAILLGTDGFIALPAGEFRELSADCIYSIAELAGDDAGDGGLTVVNLANGAVGFEPLSLASSSAFWFQPTLGSHQK